MKREKLRVAVVGGCGDWGRRYTYAYSRHPEAELIALVDTARERRARFAEHYGIPRQFDTVEDLLAWQVPDVVANILPVSAARDAVIACAEAGVKGISCEKPIAAQAGRRRCHGRRLRGARRGVRLRHRLVGGTQGVPDRLPGCATAPSAGSPERRSTASWRRATRCPAWAA